MTRRLWILRRLCGLVLLRSALHSLMCNSCRFPPKLVRRQRGAQLRTWPWLGWLQSRKALLRCTATAPQLQRQLFMRNAPYATLQKANHTIPPFQRSPRGPLHRIRLDHSGPVRLMRNLLLQHNNRRLVTAAFLCRLRGPLLG